MFKSLLVKLWKMIKHSARILVAGVRSIMGTKPEEEIKPADLESETFSWVKYFKEMYTTGDFKKDIDWKLSKLGVKFTNLYFAIPFVLAIILPFPMLYTIGGTLLFMAGYNVRAHYNLAEKFFA